uniref:Uncharacterized protein n=1 Tax=Arundo donax TaxID=35708 RepID=A0A0A9GLZ4_ARUDO
MATFFLRPMAGAVGG